MPPSPVTKRAKTDDVIDQVVGHDDPVASSGKEEGAEHPSVTLFRDYLRIKSVQPDPDYASCIEFLKKQAARLDLDYHVTEMVAGKPIFIMTWPGLEPELPSVLLNSHTDVVPVYEEHWKHDPFAAVKEENGDIYARGTQDMKSVGIQHIEAIYRLKVEQGKRFKRTIHLCFIADEEIGGHDGMAKYVLSQEFKKLNIGLALDEGLATPDDVIPVYYGERNVFWVKFHCHGNPGHGSRFIKDTAAEKVSYLTTKLLGYREEQKKKFEADPDADLGDFTTINLTYMEGGIAGGTQLNVVPNKFIVGFDMRICPTTNIEKFEQQLNQWCTEAGEGIEVDYLNKFTDRTLTSVAESDPWFAAFKKGCEASGVQTVPRIFSGATDSRFIREVGVPALGFSPMNRTPVLLHDHNEFLNENIFLEGINVFCNIVKEIANV